MRAVKRLTNARRVETEKRVLLMRGPRQLLALPCLTRASPQSASSTPLVATVAEAPMSSGPMTAWTSASVTKGSFA